MSCYIMGLSMCEVLATSNLYAAMAASNSVSKFNDYLQSTFPQDSKRTISGNNLKEDLIQISTSVKKNQFQLLDLPEAGRNN